MQKLMGVMMTGVLSDGEENFPMKWELETSDPICYWVTPAMRWQTDNSDRCVWESALDRQITSAGSVCLSLSFHVNF